MLFVKGEETTALRCPYCKRSMSKLLDNSGLWHCKECNSTFNENSFINKI